ncbi:phosphoribosylformylglycinamidine synthase subunit PurQ [Methanoculleus horonobensis]|uniref:phosphoribosylformylglycinamidine synthase subunit PurQ n=1 Tax=Methanoculleus horonobensis TaxID=528314 RepID=UPI00082A783E|nr:phosphoribosylformylglycinamidine synthase subunit PurQ [Methanoculleus horonobensis]
MRFGVVQFGGSNCSRDAYHVLADVCGVEREGEVIRPPIGHAEGRYVAPDEVLARPNREGRVAFRFCDEHDNVNPESNPNGSAEKIAGVLSATRNVLAMMPHPGRASEPVPDRMTESKSLTR